MRWPQLMKRRTVLEYLEVSEQAFLREVSEGRMPAAITFGGREHWRKDAIDAAIIRLDGTAVPEWTKELETRYGKVA